MRPLNPCVKSTSLYNCIEHVYGLDRLGVIHGYAVPAGGGDSTLLAQIGGRFAPSKDAYVILVKTENGLFLTILQRTLNHLIECTGVVRIEESAPAAMQFEESVPAAVRIEESVPAAVRIEESAPAAVRIEESAPAAVRMAFTATVCSLRALVEDRLRVNPCAYALVLLMMRGVGYRGPLTCRASTPPAYTLPAPPYEIQWDDEIYTLEHQEPELNSPREGAAPVPIPVPDGINAFGNDPAFDDTVYPSIHDMGNPVYVAAACGNPAYASAIARADSAFGTWLVHTNPAFAASLARADPAWADALARCSNAHAASSFVRDRNRYTQTRTFSPLPYSAYRA
jgi:hypothetical protein